jgi:hypothetical protein
MIRVNDDDWPLLVIAVGRDDLEVAASQLPALSRLCLPDPRAIIAVVHGGGPLAITRLDTLVRWMRQFELLVMTHARGIAWSIEDEMLRASVAAQLHLQDGYAFGCPTHVFGTVPPAMDWLGDLLAQPARVFRGA